MKIEHKKLFIPGPTEVREEILREISKPVIGHRTKEISELFSEIVPKLRELLFTKNKILIFTSSSTGVMEAAILNCVKKRVLVPVCGAFSERWAKIAKSCGKEVETIEVEWGKAILPEMIEKKLKEKDFDAVALVHNETSTGVMNPLEGIGEVLKNYPNICFLVDAVSSLAGVKIEVDKLGIDVILAGVQKCFALPPGIAVCAVSEKALERAKEIENRGFYFDFLHYLKKFEEKRQTPETPAVSLLYGLNRQLDYILREEGLERRFQRHKEMAQIVQNFAREKFALFPDENYLSLTLTCVANNRNIEVSKLREELRKRGKEISDGYGKLKGKCFRIAHMGDLQPSDIKELLADIEEILNI